MRQALLRGASLRFSFYREINQCVPHSRLAASAAVRARARTHCWRAEAARKKTYLKKHNGVSNLSPHIVLRAAYRGGSSLAKSWRKEKRRRSSAYSAPAPLDADEKDGKPQSAAAAVISGTAYENARGGASSHLSSVAKTALVK